MNWMTVKELAAYLKISDMMVYKLAQSGEIPASKIGTIWRFNQEEVDSWLMKSRDTYHIPPKVKDAIDDIVHAAKKEFGKNLTHTILFGSFARGDATEDSDVDLLFVFKKIKDYPTTRQKVSNLIYDHTYGKGKCILASSIVMLEEEFLTDNSPLILNIRKEGKSAA